jgi:glycosyltransferase involved in cell wall biosynthesis
MTLTYSLITPARDEASNLVRLAACLERQTIPPTEWVIVDDGSTDDSAAVVADLAARHAWVSGVDSSSVGRDDRPLTLGRLTGRDVIAFTAGVAALRQEPDVVVKLDADVSFDGDFFERVLDAFAAEPTLGMCSGLCLELEDGEWRPARSTRDHVRGATRSYRWRCFQDVSPLVERLGWDTVDETRARLRGWTARTLDDVPFYHHRPMGSRDGRWRAWQLQGATAWFLGYRFPYLLARSLYRVPRDPYALALLSGWLRAAARREPRYPDAAVRAYLRSQQRLRRIGGRARQAAGR